ncbi:MAG: cadherin-like domain-containing protein [Anaerolineales bacterium]|nr:cadherin-like domain-containing protein [Anaerolineales bacterium]
MNNFFQINRQRWARPAAGIGFLLAVLLAALAARPALAAGPVITGPDPVEVTMSEDGSPTAFGLTLNASDGDDDPLTWSIHTPAGHGTAVAAGTGTSKVIDYTPEADYNGSDSFIVQVSDGSLTDTVTVNVTIAAANDAPVVVDLDWQAVGGAGLSAAAVNDVGLALDNSDRPVVAFPDSSNGSKATVMRFDNGSWQLVGSAGFSAGGADQISLALDSSDNPVVVFQDGGNNNKATVMRYNGSSWQTVGDAGFSSGAASNL